MDGCAADREGWFVLMPDERPGLELVDAFLLTKPTFREFKKWLQEELAALDAENTTEYDEDWQ